MPSGLGIESDKMRASDLGIFETRFLQILDVKLLPVYVNILYLNFKHPTLAIKQQKEMKKKKREQKLFIEEKEDKKMETNSSQKQKKWRKRLLSRFWGNQIFNKIVIDVCLIQC